MTTPERSLQDYAAAVCERTEIRRGVPLPMGIHEVGGGVNFALFSGHASRICGSADIYANTGKCPECSINFVTCHDNFTLNDLVSSRGKHNDGHQPDIPTCERYLDRVRDKKLTLPFSQSAT